MGFSIHPLNSGIQHMRSFIRTILISGLFVTSLLAVGGCAETSSITTHDVITVTGNITVRGNVPFTEVVLITDDNNWYLLELSPEQRQALLTPARATVMGRIRLGEWNGRPYTRMAVSELIPVRE